MNIEELGEGSDTSDEDYMPNLQEDLPSEIDSDGNLEEPSLDPKDFEIRGRTRQKTLSINKPKKKQKTEIKESGGSKENENKEQGEKNVKKADADDIWADFIKDTGFRPKTSIHAATKSTTTSTKTKNSPKEETKKTSQKPQEKVKVTEIFEFAGEEVKIEKEVAADSAEARLLNKTSDDSKPNKGKRSGGLSGIGNVLSQLSKKPKISTLEKSKLDWDKFKKEENIEEELQTFNKGKDGYLDKQDFLQRADLRRFEIEKDIRTVERNKRFNSTL